MASKNTPDQIISGAGWGVQFLGGALNGLLAHGISREDIHRLGTPAGAADMERGIAAFVKALADNPLDPREYLNTLPGF